MSFLWHGLTDQGAQVPVQVDAQGRVIAVDGTPGVSNWDRTNGVLSPAVLTDSVEVGSGKVNLNASGSASFVDGGITMGGYLGGDFSIKGNANGGLTYLTKNQAIGYSDPQGTNATWSLNNPDGSAIFTGIVTAPNITFRSADPKFYSKKSKNKDALPEYVGPELDLLAEIARLEALVRHLYETLRLTPPAGWPVWDGNDDVLRQLRK